MTLDQVRRGQRFMIDKIQDEFSRMQTLRFGIGEGSEAACFEVIPGGPIILSAQGQEIAVGRQLARTIKVSPLVHGGETDELLYEKLPCQRSFGKRHRFGRKS